MKRRKNNFLALLYILTLSGLLIAANQAFGTDQGSDEEYDEETYGPAERIEFHHPANQTFFDHPSIVLLYIRCKVGDSFSFF